jgi:hypothetical protein
MFINISDSKESTNKGSSSTLVHYLEKENRFAKNKEPEYWFNGREIKIDPYVVMTAIDNNIAKLGKADAKFFLVNISPSQKEIAFLREQYGDDGVKDQLKGFAVRVMDAYAQNFKREGINSSEDLVWFAKLENHRYYTHKDPEVKQGLKKRGDRKEGEQMHIQVIVSRKDATNKIKLSPQNNSRGKNAEHSAKMGQFDRVAFKQVGESLFDNLFEFDRELKDSMAYANTLKNGDLAEKINIERLELQAAEIINANELKLVISLQESSITTSPVVLGSFYINITDDVDDEATNGRRRQRNKGHGR